MQGYLSMSSSSSTALRGPSVSLHAVSAEAGGAGLGNTTKFTDEFSLRFLGEAVEGNSVYRTFVDPATGEITQLEKGRKEDEWKKSFDPDGALLERWLLQRYAQRILSRPQYWLERDKVQPSPYTDLTAKVTYCDVQTRKEITVLSHLIGQPVERTKNNALISGELFCDIKTRAVRSTESMNKAPTFRVVACYRRKVPKQQASLYKNDTSGSVTWHNVAVCGSVWTCPLCSAKINRKRREEISRAYNVVSEVSGAAYMLTFTIKHGLGDDLDDLISRMKNAMQDFQKSQAMKEVTRKEPLKRPRADSLPFVEYIGRIANLEVTYGTSNGWHPHEHHLWFFRRELTEQEIQFLKDRLFDAWATACVKNGLPEPLKENREGRSIGLDIRRALSAADYLTKYGQFTPDGDQRVRRWGPEKELAGSHVKAAKAKGATPFQLLFEYAEGDKRSGQKFTEFAVAFKGRHQLEFSKTLKKFLRENEVIIDETEAGDQLHAQSTEAEAELLYSLTDHEFDKVVRNHAHAMVVLFAKTHGLPAAVAYIASLPTNVQPVDRDSAFSQPSASPP